MVDRVQGSDILESDYTHARLDDYDYEDNSNLITRPSYI
jgi:hypothetical protein